MDNNADEGDYLAVHLAAQLAGVSERTLRHWIKRGKVPAIAGNRGNLVRLADVQGVAHLAGMSRQEMATLPSDSEDSHLAVHLADSGRQETALEAPREDQTQALLAVIEAAYNGQRAAKEELIAELRRRAEVAEERAAQLERTVRRQQRPWWQRLLS